MDRTDALIGVYVGVVLAALVFFAAAGATVSESYPVSVQVTDQNRSAIAVGLSAGGSAIDFGTVPVGATTATRTATIRNGGSRPATVTIRAGDGIAPYIAVTPQHMVVWPGTTRYVTITLNVSGLETGPYHGRLVVEKRWHR